MDGMKVKRRIIALALAIIIATLSLVGCSTTVYQDAENINVEEYAGGYFTVIKEWARGNDKLVYANDTKVMYFFSYKNGITPLYNADGTLQIYDGE